MPYTIKNNYTQLKLTLVTYNGNYSNIRLNTYINDSTTIYKTYTPSSTVIPNLTNVGRDDKYQLIFTIPTSDYEIDDVISKFELVTNTSTHLYDTHEGIIWLIDGVESDPQYTNTYTTKFEDNEAHTVEAVYVGNDALQMKSTGKVPVLVKQPPIDEEGSLSNDGAYHIEFVNKGLKTLTYKDHTKIEFLLTKGGVPVVTTPARNIEIQTPKSIVSTTLNNQGKGSVWNSGVWDAGKYKIGAFYQDEREGRQHIVTRTEKTITIKKGTPVFTDNSGGSGNFVPNSKYKLVLKFDNEPLANAKITLYVNGKAKTYTTDSKGAVYYKFPTVKTYKLKAVYKGNKNLNKVEKTVTIKVVKSNG